MAFLPIYEGSERAGKSLVDDHLEEFLIRRLGYSKAKLRMKGKYVGARLGRRADTKKFVLLHHMVWERHTGRKLPNGQMIDHVNQNLLDNRIENLRVVDASERQANSPKHSDNSTGFNGVSKKKGGEFAAGVGKDRRQHHLGSYDTTFAAAHAVNCGYAILFPNVPIPNPLAANDLTSHQREQIKENVNRLLDKNRLPRQRRT